MSRNGNPSVFQVLGHSLLTLMTGGFWLVVLLIWHVLKKR